MSGFQPESLTWQCIIPTTRPQADSVKFIPCKELLSLLNDKNVTMWILVLCYVQTEIYIFLSIHPMKFPFLALLCISFLPLLNYLVYKDHTLILSFG